MFSSWNSVSVITREHLIFRFPLVSFNLAQELRWSVGESLVTQPHVLLSDGQGTVQTLTGQLKVIHGHLQNIWEGCDSVQR